MSVTTGGGTVRNAFSVPAGMIADFGHANDPGLSVGDWLECNGQNVLRATYATLFGKIGITFGAGDGVSTFGLPDARRRSRVGKGGVGTGTLANTVAATGGEETHTLSNGEAPTLSHSHPNTINFSDELTGSSGVFSLKRSSNFQIDGTIADNPATTAPGGGGAHNTYHPVFVCGVWIKT